MKQVKVKPVKAPEISSSFAILDVKKGRRAELIDQGPDFLDRLKHGVRVGSLAPPKVGFSAFAGFEPLKAFLEPGFGRKALGQREELGAREGIVGVV